MTDLRFDAFDWDEGNDTKSLAKHGLGTEAIESVFRSQPFIMDDTRHSEQEQRFLAVGIGSDGRWILVAFTIRPRDGKRYLRPISARYMHAKEVSRHENATKDQG